MACKYKYNDKWFTENELIYLIGEKRNLLDISNKQALERLNSLQEIFKQAPQLQEIGTIFDYDSYLDTIFPDSKVKDIVYHGSPNVFEEFSDALKGKNTIINRPIGIYFTPNKEIANFLYQGSREEKFDEQGFRYREKINTGKVYAVLLNLDYIKAGDNFIHEKDPIDEYDTEGLLEYDAYIAKNKKQIHILGSKQDIENFANFVTYENSNFSKIGNINQFRDYIMSKNFAAIEEFLVVNNKIDRKC